MVPKLLTKTKSPDGRFRAVLFRMVPKLWTGTGMLLSSFRAVLFRMVPKHALTQGFAAGIETGQWYQVTNNGPAKVDMVNLNPLAKAAQKAAQAFENLAKRASETISKIFQR